MKRLIIVFGILMGLASFVANCTQRAAEPVQNFGWEPPPAPETREFLYGEPDESLRAQAPELFK